MEKKEFLTSLVPEPTEFTCNTCDKKFESLDNFTLERLSYEILLLTNKWRLNLMKATVMNLKNDFDD